MDHKIVKGVNYLETFISHFVQVNLNLHVIAI